MQLPIAEWLSVLSVECGKALDDSRVRPLDSNIESFNGGEHRDLSDSSRHSRCSRSYISSRAISAGVLQRYPPTPSKIGEHQTCQLQPTMKLSLENQIIPHQAQYSQLSRQYIYREYQNHHAQHGVTRAATLTHLSPLPLPPLFRSLSPG